jgi:APA family basic amino acid/polyamine antiporter
VGRRSSTRAPHLTAVTNGIRERTIGRAGFFALSFGSIVGSGWVILLGEWLRVAGPGGAALALAAGGMYMALIGMCYAELAGRMPQAGAEFRYALEVLGRRSAWAVGWFLTLFFVAISAFEGTALAWLIGVLWPRSHDRTLYVVMGQAITLPDLSIGLVGLAIICGINLRGVTASVLFQRCVTFAFIGFMAILLIASGVAGHGRNLIPAFSSASGGDSVTGILWVFSTCSMLLYGFPATLHLIEERRRDIEVRSATNYMIGGIVGAAAFYSLLVLAAASLQPWRELIDLSLPAASAFDGIARGGWISQAVVIVALASLLKTWNGVLMMASRLLAAQASAGLLPESLGRIEDRSRAPRSAVWVATLASAVGVACGRAALLPIVNTAVMSVTIIIAIMVWIALRVRRLRPEVVGFVVPGGAVLIPVTLLLATAIAIIAALQPLWRSRGVPVEWAAVAAWGVLGIALTLVTRVGRSDSEN